MDVLYGLDIVFNASNFFLCHKRLQKIDAVSMNKGRYYLNFFEELMFQTDGLFHYICYFVSLNLLK